MKFSRRRFLQLTAGAAALPTMTQLARAQTFPSRPVRIIVGNTAGGSTDIVARLIGQRLSERLGQPFIVENRPGASGNIAAEATVRAPADGHTLLLISSTNAANVTLFENLNFDLTRDLAPVAAITRGHLVLQLNPSVPARSVPELIAYARAHPGKLSFASVGSGSTPHLAGVLFAMMAGVDMIHVPYRGGGHALTDLMGGQVQLMITNLPAIEHNQAGKLRALAVTTATRSEAMPGLPAIGEFVRGYEASVWFGISAPKHTPTEIIDTLNKTINSALTDPKIKERLTDFGGTALSLSPTEFGKLISDETEKWGKVIRAANVRPE